MAAMTTPLNEQERVHYNRVIWHSRRGMLELDLVLEPYVKNRYLELGEQDRERYCRLLTCEDQQLFNWFLNKEPVDDPELAEIVQNILEYSKSR